MTRDGIQRGGFGVPRERKTLPVQKPVKAKPPPKPKPKPPAQKKKKQPDQQKLTRRQIEMIERRAMNRHMNHTGGSGCVVTALSAGVGLIAVVASWKGWA